MVNKKEGKRSYSRLHFIDNHSLLKCKRSQVTIFIILALAIVIVLILLFIRRADFGVVFTPKTPIDNIKECSSDALKEGIDIISSQGGSLNPKNYYLYNGSRVEYLCYSSDYYERCVMQKPLLKQSVEEELKNYLTPKIRNCLESQKEALEKNSYSVSFKNPNVIVELVPDNILVNIESDLKIEKGQTETYKSIKIDKNSKLYELVMITSSILNWEARYGDSEIMNYMIYYPDLRVEKKKQDEGTNIYIITDKNTGDKFMFASRSLAAASGITGN